ncbi:hypothetical protein FGF66_11000 [Chlorobaculum thiosulfatiphilum]|uniref:Uncharacterized protein n=1 Tax=Chlorobaculum thiosulfatiphilum TaxID=115852 RepID=A0A5C4S217_CHLTI|nr:hypothetical protein [Chlorobaculum thiosulfatiphilum]TNJ37177.1 hypothetical protein FGF66_11000 [Chlorobaculum thiosulfatiphilum]
MASSSFRLLTTGCGERPGDEHEAPRSDGETRHPFEPRRKRRREQGGDGRDCGEKRRSEAVETEILAYQNRGGSGIAREEVDRK